MKYIDADKLSKAIEDKGLDCSFVLKMERLDTLALIDSLQQEHPAKRGYKDCNGCEYNRLLKDQIGWQFRGCFGGDDKRKPIAEIELCPLKLAVQQEQPEVELEKASRNVYESWKGGTMDDFLRDMVELGKALNARKEE